MYLIGSTIAFLEKLERRKGGANPKANPQGGEGTNRGHGGRKTGLKIITMEEAEDLSKKPSYKTNSYYSKDFGLSLTASGPPSKFPRPSRSLRCRGGIRKRSRRF